MSILTKQLTEIIAASGATSMGVALHHIESGEEIHLDAGESFPMASVLKIPVLVEALRQLREGRFALDDRWPLTSAEKNIGSGILTYMQDGVTPTVRDLLTLMIIISDNTATDMVMHRLGVERINQTMHELGLADIHMALTIRGIFDDMLGEASDPARLFVDLDKPKTAPPTRRDGRAFSSGPDNNVSTPRDMTRLLAMIFRGEIIDRAACDGMLHILLQQQLNARLPLFLPYGVPFAHKTGTLAGIRNDAGVLYCSADSHVAVTVFARWDTEAVKDDKVAEWERISAIDAAFGHIGRAVYDYFQM
ncbi:MAG: serine hydrolase [Caldilineaceae bacterium]|nr:serine hydrolase [Caldilineaceae bacterium]